MSSISYFKRTFTAAFIFIITYRIVIQLFEGISGFTLQFAFRTFLVAIITALILGTLNYFYKVDILKKNNN